MTRPRERRLEAEPDPLDPEEEVDDEAVVEAKYRLLHRRLKRYQARLDARRAEGSR